MRSLHATVNGPGSHDRATALICFGTAAGMMMVATCGCLSELALGVGGHLTGLMLVSLGYLCCGLQQQSSIWFRQRSAEKNEALRMTGSLSAGCLSHAEVLPPGRINRISLKEARLFQANTLNCI